MRYGYFARELGELALPGRRVLDVGCGGGFLVESFAKDGHQVTGIDRSGASIAAARAHAALTGLEVRYLVGVGEGLRDGDFSNPYTLWVDDVEFVPAGPAAPNTPR